METNWKHLDDWDASSPFLPSARGDLSAYTLELLVGRRPSHQPAVPAGFLASDDGQLALYCCYELGYRSFAGISPDAEWDPRILAWRAALEARFETELVGLVGSAHVDPQPVGSIGARVQSVALGDACVGDDQEDRSAVTPSLSAYLAESGTVGELQEFLIHRSAYQLKEADPHTFGLPRFGGRSRAAMVEIQMDEYGEGRPGRSHAELFASTMRGAGLDAAYGSYLDRLPGVTLACCNLATLFGLHRRLLPALIGHLAVFELTSVVPMGRYSRALERHGFGPDVRHFYDTHVVADAHHGPLARDGLVQTFVDEFPDGAGLVLFGARSVMELERRFADHLLTSWSEDRTSLFDPVPVAAAPGPSSIAA